MLSGFLRLPASSVAVYKQHVLLLLLLLLLIQLLLLLLLVMLLLLQTDCIWAAESIASLVSAALPQFAAGERGFTTEGAAAAATQLLQQQRSNGASFFTVNNSSSSSIDTGFACKLLRGLELLQQTPQLWGGGGAQQQLQQQQLLSAATCRGAAAVRVDQDFGYIGSSSGSSTGSTACVHALLQLGAAFLAAAPHADASVARRISEKVFYCCCCWCCSCCCCCLYVCFAAAVIAGTTARASAAAAAVAAANATALRRSDS